MANVIKLNVYEVIDKAAAASSRADKIKILQQNDSWALKDVLRATYDESIEWLLPGGKPPYEPAPEESPPTNLLKQHKQFEYFVNTPRARSILKLKRETMFVNFLESIHPKDAELMLLVINKQQLGKGITKKIVEEAFPGLIKR